MGAPIKINPADFTPTGGPAVQKIDPKDFTPTGGSASITPISTTPAPPKALGQRPQAPGRPTGGVFANIEKAQESAGPPLTDPRIGPAIGAELLGPTGSMVGEAAGAAAGLGKWGMALARTAGMTAATAPLGGKNAVQQAGWTAGLGLATEGALAGAGRYSGEAGRAADAAKVTGEMTPPKIKSLDAERTFLQSGGSSPEQVDDFINSRDAAQKTKDAFHSVISNQKNEYRAGYQGIFDKPATTEPEPVAAAPAQSPPPTQTTTVEINGKKFTVGPGVPAPKFDNFQEQLEWQKAQLQATSAGRVQRLVQKGTGAAPSAAPPAPARKPTGITIGQSPVDPAPIAQKIDELNAEVDRRGLNPQESAATKKLLDGMRSNLKGAPVAGGEDPVKTVLRSTGTPSDELDTMSPRALENYRNQFIKDGWLTPEGKVPGPTAGQAPTVDQVHGFRTSLRNLRGASATNTTEWISNALEDTATQVMQKGMVDAGAKPEDFTTLKELDGKWRTLNNMEYTFRNLKGAEYGHAAANALWDIGESKNYETLNDFFKMTDKAATVDPTIKPALKESFLTKLVGDAKEQAGTDLNSQGLIYRKITDNFRSKTPEVMRGLFGDDSPFADVRQFSKVMGKSTDPNTTNKLKSTMNDIISKPAKVAAYGGSGFFLFRLGYSLATGDSPWQDLKKNPGQFAAGMAEVAATGAIASLILTRGSAAQQRAWADMMLHPESAATVRTFSEIATPLVAENVMKGMVAKQAQSAPAKP